MAVMLDISDAQQAEHLLTDQLQPVPDCDWNDGYASTLGSASLYIPYLCLVQPGIGRTGAESIGSQV